MAVIAGVLDSVLMLLSRARAAVVSTVFGVLLRAVIRVIRLITCAVVIDGVELVLLICEARARCARL